MKTTTKRATKSGAMAAKSWDAVWGAYCAAKRSGDEQALTAAKAQCAAWHEQMGQTPPSWTW
jgi:hypothetical protein